MKQDELNMLLDQLEEAYRTNDLAEINRLNRAINEGIGVSVNSSVLDYELMESVKSKKHLRKNLEKVINGEDMGLNETLKFLSSFITHIIIECDVRGNNRYKDYSIPMLNKMMDEVIERGKITEEVSKYFKDRYKPFLA